jgi:hypothetical protein
MTIFPITLRMSHEADGAFSVEPETFPFETVNSGVDQMGALAFLGAINNQSFKNGLLKELDCNNCDAAAALGQNPMWMVKIGVRHNRREAGLLLACQIHQALEKMRKASDPGVVGTAMTTPCEAAPHKIEVRTLGDRKP